MSGFDFNALTTDKLLSPQFYRDVAGGLSKQATDLRARYVPYMENYQVPHHTFFGGLFGKTETKQRIAYPAGYQQAMGDATSFENQSLYYKALADYIEANPQKAPTDSDVAAMDPNGPDQDKSMLTIDLSQQRADLNRSATINTSGPSSGLGVRIPYGT